jgi:membrane protein
MDITGNRGELRLLYRAVRRALEGDGRDTAAAIAFYAFFALFPLLLVAMSTAGFMFDSMTAQARLSEILDRSLPGSAALVTRQVEAVVDARGALGLIGVIGLIWSASAAMGAAGRAVNRSLGVRHGKSAFKAKLQHLSLTALVSLGLSASLLLSSISEVLAAGDLAVLRRIGLETGLAGRFAGFLTAAVLAFGTFAVLYRTLPRLPVKWHEVLPGAIVATILFEVSKAGFLLYLTVAADYEAVYGSLSAIIVLMIWLVVCAWVFVVGAEYNSVRLSAFTEP